MEASMNGTDVNETGQSVLGDVVRMPAEIANPATRAILYVVAPSPEKRAEQIENLKKLAAARCWNIWKICQETNTKRRPWLRWLTDEGRKGNLANVVILVDWISYLGRSRTGGFHVAMTLHALGIEVVSVHEQEWWDAAAPWAKWFDEGERRRREKSKKAIAGKRERGEATGNLPLGFCRGDNGGVLEDADEQALIDRVVELQKQNLSLGYIAQIVNQEGHRSRNGTPFTHTQIRRILRRFGESTQ
jgi:DNA invertase Pin-like site-specific DNA recombinase